jgi:DNA-binding response OmpR family regulator
MLIVEDEPMIAFMLEELLVDAGYAIAGVATKLPAALAIIEGGACDVAILDANLAGVSSSPAAAMLTARGVPFVVLSGYSSEQHHGELAKAICLQKPCSPARLIDTLRRILPAVAAP